MCNNIDVNDKKPYTNMVNNLKAAWGKTPQDAPRFMQADDDGRNTINYRPFCTLIIETTDVNDS